MPNSNVKLPSAQKFQQEEEDQFYRLVSMGEFNKHLSYIESGLRATFDGKSRIVLPAPVLTDLHIKGLKILLQGWGWSISAKSQGKMVFKPSRYRLYHACSLETLQRARKARIKALIESERLQEILRFWSAIINEKGRQGKVILPLPEGLSSIEIEALTRALFEAGWRSRRLRFAFIFGDRLSLTAIDNHEDKRDYAENYGTTEF